MALVVFMRGVNVGGHKAFKPSALAKDLAALDAVNVGAAGTFVIRGRVAEPRLRAELRRRMPFEVELMVCRGGALLELSSRYSDAAPEKDERRFLSVMAKPPRNQPRLPLRRPDGKQWQVEITEVAGSFAVSLWRRRGRTLLYPNEVVEKELAVSATTRNWNTLASICGILSAAR